MGSNLHLLKKSKTILVISTPPNAVWIRVPLHHNPMHEARLGHRMGSKVMGSKTMKISLEILQVRCDLCYRCGPWASFMYRADCL